MTATIYYRTYAHVDLELRSTPGGGRTIYGIAVPYGQPMQIDETLIEQFAYGAFADQVRGGPSLWGRVPFAREHLPLGGSIIGATRLLREDRSGLYGEWEVARTPAGEETLELFKIGALRDLSIGFREGRSRATTRGITERLTSTLREVAMVREGAYGELATAQGVRSAQAVPFDPPSTTPNLDLARSMTLPAL